jgi:CHAT domain-containing protein
MPLNLEEDIKHISNKKELREFCKLHFDSNDQRLADSLNERVNFLIRTDLNLALRLANEFQRASRFFDHPLQKALAKRAKARVLHMVGKHREAIRVYDQTVKVYQKEGKLLDVAKINRAKVDALMYLGRYKQALDSAEVARQIFRKQNRLVDLAQLETNVGNLYHRLDENRKALKHYDKARKVFLTQNNPVFLARIEFNRANIFSNLNDTETALRLYDKSRDLYGQAGMKLAEAQAKYSIAYVHFLCNDFTQAIKMLLEVKREFHELGDRSGEALCDLDLSEIYLQLNAFHDSLESGLRAKKTFQDSDMRYETAKVITLCAVCLFHLEDHKEAERNLKEAQNLFHQEKNKIWVALVDLYLAELYLKQKKAPPSLEKLKAAQRMFQSQGLLQKAGQAQLILAKAQHHRAETKIAHRLYQKVLKMAREQELPGLSYRCHHLIGQLQKERKEWDKAYLSYKNAIADIEKMRIGIAPEEFKLTFFEDKLAVYEDMIKLCLETPSLHKPEDAFRYLESTKSKTLLEMLSSELTIESAPRSNVNPELIQSLNRLRADLDWLYNKSTQGETQAVQRGPQFKKEISRQIKRKEKKLMELCREIKLNQDEFLRPHSTVNLTSDEIQKHLRRDEVIIEYFLTDRSLDIFLIDRNQLRVLHQVCSAGVLKECLRGLRFQLDKFLYGRDYVELHQVEIYQCAIKYLSQLYHLLIQPLKDLISGKKLIIIPYGILHLVPFSALSPGLSGKGREGFLIDEHEISLAPSSFVYKLCCERKRGNHRKVAIFGVPTETVPAVEREAKAVKSIFPRSQLFLKEESTKEKFFSEGPNALILHMACHAIFREDNPLFSALRLFDGWLSFYDLLGLNLKADLVTLSGCHTGSTQVTGGDELLGIFRGFLLSGSSSLLVTLWAVGDVSTAFFMESFYRHFKRGMTKRAALKQAVLDTRERYSHPYFWAPFMLMGKN